MMDDNEHVCPLCCEELDISDQQFFPCKCGYQVCMWCWHRIRESESGLCPACRTPYGDDPHEFSAVDVQEVLKANREKEAAAKRERERQRQQTHSSDGSGGLGSGAGHNFNGSYAIAEDGTPLTGIMEVPKDRTQLANMRVIRRNLVYAVGLPPSIANEDFLRRPEYFGQYGRIAKIVLNRSQASNGDPRRASCSAYVTFVHKEDTLVCILALDGFYLENRNIRASYGTSKYCSAFIKNVRCNNPECTYLHEMGAVEDTFTKQEIQAGYVTSGRDVLARQQQIVQQALNATSQGMAGTAPRRKVGGGGPSGTGKGASNPIFPAPEFDEPTKPAPLVPAPTGMSRAASTGTGFPTVTAAAQQTVAKPITRSASTGTTKAAVSGAVQPAARKGILSSGSTDPPLSQAPATAASVVAGVHSASGGIGSAPTPRTTLTPLTPLKRTNNKTTAAKPAASTADTNTLSMPTISNSYPKPQKAVAQRIGSSKNQNDTSRGTSTIVGTMVGATATTTATATAAPASTAPAPAPVAPPSPALPAVRNMPTSASLTPLKDTEDQQHQPSSLSSLGGEVIAAPERSKASASVGAIGSPFSGGPRTSSASVGPGAFNRLDGRNDIIGGRPMGLSGLGGEVFTGPLSSPGPKSAIGSGKDKWGSNHFSGSGAVGQPIGPPGGLWGGRGSNSNLQGISGSPVGNHSIGGGVIGSHMPSHGLSNEGAFGAPGPHNSGSNALASILGINLPTGSGSLRTPMPAMPSQGIIGRSNSGSSGLIGGVPIGGNPIGMGGPVVNQAGTIGNSNKNDIALLQSLLPQVHITRGNGAPQNGWNAGRGQHQQPVGVGAVGRNMPHQAQPQGAAGNLNIW
ncbi:CCR4-NOT transcription complex subunit 4 [Seminavis robusta]|uniref:CCR4-NOT transcription complex subunit 4 n=1 Tax=Seminavis robusta TaxID=568900 RepID=A0A9N8DN05_9STRA|nr:CCR4-NOT transcription complex subunit 4 [Seminavis robusta]|eukprot:Sro168_g074710.1 CCR4-NOT transcription complex subunit 4 (855) ;mRNA; f:16731-20036